jgi:hypothetical protein
MARGKWVDVGSQVKGLSEETWKTYWTEMSAAEAIEFIKDPKRELIKDGLIGEDYRVEIRVVNADVASVDGPSCKVLMVFPEEKLALITEYRHPNVPKKK